MAKDSLTITTTLLLDLLETTFQFLHNPNRSGKQATALLHTIRFVLVVAGRNPALTDTLPVTPPLTVN